MKLEQYQYNQLGFSLIELAIVLFIVALLLGGLLVPITVQLDQQKTKDTQKTLADLKEALIGFAVVNGRLPCPAKPSLNTGLENPIGGGACTNFFDGYVPATTLGLTPVNGQGYLVDGWNNPIRYAVSPKTIGMQANALTSPNGIKTATIGSISTASPLLVVCSNAAGITGTGCGPTPTVQLTNNAPAVIFSVGKNANISGTLGPDESANTNNDLVFVSHEQSSGGAGNEEFDDIVTWLSTGVLISRMVAAGQLP